MDFKMTAPWDLLNNITATVRVVRITVTGAFKMLHRVAMCGR